MTRVPERREGRREEEMTTKADLVCTKDKLGYPSCQIMTQEGDALSDETFDLPDRSLEGIGEAVERIEFWENKGYDVGPAKESLKGIIKNDFCR